jgi:hypothetical protein
MMRDLRDPPSARGERGASDPARSRRGEDERSLLLAMLVRFIEAALAQGRGSRAVVALARRTQAEIEKLAAVAGGELRVTFTTEAVFVGGHPVQAAREVLTPAIELGRLFARQGIVELGFPAGLQAEALLDLGDLLASAIREPTGPRVTADSLVGLVVRGSVEPRTSPSTPADRAVDLYLAGLARLRAFYGEIAEGGAPDLAPIKRLAQELVSLHEVGDGLLLGLGAFAPNHRDDAGRALHAAILCVVSAARLTMARVALSRLALAALLSGAGRARLSLLAEGAAHLPDPLDLEVPAAIAAVSVAAGPVHRGSALRSTTLFEAAWLAREGKLGPLYGGRRTPLFQSRLVRTARAFVERIAPRDGLRAPSPLEAFQDLARSPRVDRDALRLLAQALLSDPLAA